MLEQQENRNVYLKLVQIFLDLLLSLKKVSVRFLLPVKSPVHLNLYFRPHQKRFSPFLWRFSVVLLEFESALVGLSTFTWKHDSYKQTLQSLVHTVKSHVETRPGLDVDDVGTFRFWRRFFLRHIRIDEPFYSVEGIVAFCFFYLKTEPTAAPIKT